MVSLLDYYPFPLIGSSPYLGAVAGPSSASYPILTTLPDPMTFTVVAISSNSTSTNPPPLLIDLPFTYDTHNHSFPTITSPVTQLPTQQPLADFAIEKPLYPWWYADGLKVPA
ncbi:hypothetical protein HO173_004568 [Letharia columbiana]|uniref:Uncharacterized protein n=1 Tax=Letharia columbiana TaxID=112416 RepID=A0A8H6FY88_9LECA|nr:uncharacterized protein HO173_004568 [Letharia columbiana]KAF6237100.1 hypothetical protein HO173_004568 [Letharia columbiana]